MGFNSAFKGLTVETPWNPQTAQLYVLD